MSTSHCVRGQCVERRDARCLQHRFHAIRSDTESSSLRRAKKRRAEATTVKKIVGVASVAVAGAIAVAIAVVLVFAEPRAENDRNASTNPKAPGASALPVSTARPQAPVDSPEIKSRFARAFKAQRAGKLTEAVSQYRALLADRPDHVQVRFNLAHALMSNGQCDLARPEFQRVLELDPARSAAHLHIAKCARDAGDATLASLHQAAWEKSQPRR